MNISIIIPFVNEKEELLSTIESIEQYTEKINHYEIIVINDASDDIFDYKQYLENKENIRYYENSHRIGVAACRDIGIALSVYDKFLLLDAHMRIYDQETLPAFIAALTDNYKSIVCCRTIGIGDNPRSITPFAAYIELFGERGGLYAEWNSHDCDPASSISKVPCILGAAYAAYKEYWMFLRGLSGLVSYGSDEAYISLKVWLSGGECLVLKNIVIGHLYRKDPPYAIKHIDYIYNKVFISLLLLPNNLCMMVLSNLRDTFEIQFSFSMNILYKNLSNFLVLKEYYEKILTTPFSAFFNFNKECEAKSILNTNIEPNSMDLNKNISPNIRNNKEKDYGLYNGKMGLIISFYLQGEVTIAEKEIDDLIEYVETSNNIDITFSDGLLGIAWGLNFLIEKEMIESNINELLSDFDDIIFNRFNMNYWGDWSFEKGFLGLIYYSAMRLYQDKDILNRYPVFFKFLNKIVKERYTDESNYLTKPDFPIIALIFISLCDKGYRIINSITSIEALLHISNMKNEHKDSLFYKTIINETY